MIRIAPAIAPDVRQLLREDPSQLAAFLEEIHEEDLADLLGFLDEEETALVLRALKVEDAAAIFERLDEDRQEAVVEQIGAEAMAPIAAEMGADERTDLIESLPEAIGDSLLETLERVDPEAAAEVEELAQWPEDTAGGLMTTDYVSASPAMTVGDAIERIRELGQDAEVVYYVYVLDREERLLGVVSLRELLLARQDTPLTDVMVENVHVVAPETDQENWMSPLPTTLS